ncbi:hypothetical protein TSAR_003570 [Trichomalopsis sarcophagae]|uniref:Uncharacterized protein n=1 Tax=Trichomalopsis sarcophagae TaxID=543379 RepID=A0A232EVC2_9HYME|nr:hypothetical protein TSAR_003570 [Trichomalopsis sarcophagae]
MHALRMHRRRYSSVVRAQASGSRVREFEFRHLLFRFRLYLLSVCNILASLVGMPDVTGHDGVLPQRQRLTLL